jgi:hypothetical protein
MPTCYTCGKSIPRGHGFRRQVLTGVSKASVGERLVRSALKGNILPMFGGTREHYGLRTVCYECAGEPNPADPPAAPPPPATPQPYRSGPRTPWLGIMWVGLAFVLFIIVMASFTR